jgi:uncharacterized membrane protein YgdD (TMEM256/DUF423 family)
MPSELNCSVKELFFGLKMKVLFIFAAFLAASAIMMDAFLAHGVERFLGSAYTEIARHSLESAARYQLIFALFMFILLMFYQIQPSIFLLFSLAFIAVGQSFFVGAIYAKYLLTWTQFSFLAPIGGICFMLAFLVLLPYAWLF